MKIPLGEQLMAPLPPYRTSRGGPPFEVVGIDAAGPFMIKIGRSLHKRYLIGFNCMATGAVHYEVAPDLSTSTFINVLQCFIARKNKPRKIICDNGPNHVGAERELRELFERLDQDKIN